MSTFAPAGRDRLGRIQNGAFLAAAVGVVLCLLGLFLNRDQLFRSYLVAYCFFLGLGLGCLAILMLQFVTGGAWGLVLRRLLECGSRTVPLLALLFVPLLFGLRSVYVWADPEVVAHDPILKLKAPYLNVSFFMIRAAIYFSVWVVLVVLLNAWSRREDRTPDPGLSRRFRVFSAPGLALYGLTMTFASIDWGMSLEPHWYSTMYGVLFSFGQVLSAMCFVTAMVIVLAEYPPLRDVLGVPALRDLGNLLLAFIMIWAYLAFSQFLLIWSANLKEEVPWYLARTEGGWQWLAVSLILFHFALPFLLLLSAELKSTGRLLLAVALFVLAMRFLDMYWMLAPAFSPAHFRLHWLDLAALLAVGGIWLGFFLWQLPRMPLLPEHDPRLQEVAENHA